VSLRRKPVRATFGARSAEARPKHNRAGRYAVLVLSGGALAGVAALFGVGPFGNLQVTVSKAFHQTPVASPIEAQAIFPAVGPVHRVLDVYDAPPPATAPGGQPGPGAGGFPVIKFPAGPLAAIEATCEAAKQAAENKSEAYRQNVEMQCEAAKQAYEQSPP
jgi:hypothetical protein